MTSICSVETKEGYDEGCECRNYGDKALRTAKGNENQESCGLPCSCPCLSLPLETTSTSPRSFHTSLPKESFTSTHSTQPTDRPAVDRHRHAAAAVAAAADSLSSNPGVCPVEGGREVAVVERILVAIGLGL